ncbi:MAG TPA: hypothetical protein VFZ68_06115 [Acidimicrobiales bacterium]
MSGRDAHLPDLVPQLSRGKHRSPRKGACFMELASYLAGERWSDHPACTHPLLATLARLVNDHTSDAERHRLAGLIPPVIGLTGDDPRIDVQIVLRAATTALPVAAADRQRVLAVSILAAERAVAHLEGRPPGELQERSRRALAQVPDAAAWAERFTQGMKTSRKGFQLHAAPATLRHAVVGIAEACTPDPDAMLRDLLAGAIDDCRTLIQGHGRPDEAVDRAAWAAACELAGRRPVA